MWCRFPVLPARLFAAVLLVPNVRQTAQRQRAVHSHCGQPFGHYPFQTGVPSRLLLLPPLRQPSARQPQLQAPGGVHCGRTRQRYIYIRSPLPLALGAFFCADSCTWCFVFALQRIACVSATDGCIVRPITSCSSNKPRSKSNHLPHQEPAPTPYLPALAHFVRCPFYPLRPFAASFFLCHTLLCWLACVCCLRVS